MSVKPRLSALMITMLATLLTACGDDSQGELSVWMEGVKKDTHIAKPKLNPPKTFLPVPYDAQGDIDPFNPDKLIVVLARMKAESGGALKPDMERRKEVLENFPLDTLKMVGTIEKPGLRLALIAADNKTVYQAKAGSYIGQNFGHILRITESEMEIKEIVQDAAGEWTERNVKLELQESKK